MQSAEPGSLRRFSIGAVGILLIFVTISVGTHSSFAADEPGGLFTGSGLEITDGGRLPAAGFSPVTVRTGAEVDKVGCTFDGQFLGLVSGPPFRFATPPPAPGQHKIRCTLREASGDRDQFRAEFTVAGSMSTSGTPTSPPVTSATVPIGGHVTVSDAIGLQRALRDAQPGSSIELRDGIYDGKTVRDPTGQSPGRFTITTSGTAQAPIVLRGSRGAIVTGGGTGGGYALHLRGADHWRLEGFTVRSAAKGIVLDGADHNVIDDLRVTEIGDEGIHFRSASSDNLLTGSTVDTTGMDSPNYGEGVYIGSARSNWATYTGGQPDRSDRNQIVGNTIVDTAAESIDIKEGSTGGLVRGNVLGGDKIAGKNSADSWIDVKGNGYLIEANRGTTSPRPATTDCGDPKGDPRSVENPFCDGIQVHVILDGWGRDNTFSDNTLAVNAPGAGIWLQNTAVDAGNIIRCNNRVGGAAAGAYATNHYTALRCTP